MLSIQGRHDASHGHVAAFQRFVSLTHIERAKGVLSTHGDVPARSEGYSVYDTLILEPLNFKFESASEF